MVEWHVEIRKAKAEDAKEVLRLLGELKVSGYTEMGMDASGVLVGDNSEEFYKSMLERDIGLILLAEEEGNAIGLAVCYLTPKIFDGENRMVIEEFVISKSQRGKGVGSKLLNKVESEAKKMGVKIIKLTTGTKLRANKFYQNRGYLHFENAYRKKLK